MIELLFLSQELDCCVKASISDFSEIVYDILEDLAPLICKAVTSAISYRVEGGGGAFSTTDIASIFTSLSGELTTAIQGRISSVVFLFFTFFFIFSPPFTPLLYSFQPYVSTTNV